MATPENSFIDAVHKHLPVEDELHREGMHNPYRGGTADVWYSGRSDLWIEYKFIELSKRPETIIDLTAGKKPPLSVLQQQWLRRRTKEGRNVAVIVGFRLGPREQAGVVLLDGDWETPTYSSTYRASMRSPIELAQWIVNEVGTFSHAEPRPSARSAVRNVKSRHNGVPTGIHGDATRVHGQTLITEATARSRRPTRK